MIYANWFISNIELVLWIINTTHTFFVIPYTAQKVKSLLVP